MRPACPAVRCMATDDIFADLQYAAAATGSGVAGPRAWASLGAGRRAAAVEDARSCATRAGAPRRRRGWRCSASCWARCRALARLCRACAVTPDLHSFTTTAHASYACSSLGRAVLRRGAPSALAPCEYYAASELIHKAPHAAGRTRPVFDLTGRLRGRHRRGRGRSTPRWPRAPSPRTPIASGRVGARRTMSSSAFGALIVDTLIGEAGDGRPTSRCPRRSAPPTSSAQCSSAIERWRRRAAWARAIPVHDRLDRNLLAHAHAPEIAALPAWRCSTSS